MSVNNQLIDIDALSHFKAKQDLKNAEKFQEKGTTDLTGAVRYDTAQVLTPEQKAQARANIGVSENGGSGGGSAEGAVRYDVEQALTDEQKVKARENIGASDFDGDFINLKNLPFGYVKGKSIKWDGNTEGKVTVPVTVAELGLSGLLCKVGEYEDVPSMGYHIAYFNNFGEAVDNFEPTNYVWAENGGGGSIGHWYTDNVNIPAIALVYEPCTIQGVQFPESGVYFAWIDGSAVGAEEAGYVRGAYEIDERRKLPDDLIPDKCVTVDHNGKVPSSQLPSYVDDVIEGYYDGEFFYRYYTEFSNTYDTKMTGETGKIYVDLRTGNTYRYTGSVFVRLNPDEYTVATTSDIDALFT